MSVVTERSGFYFAWGFRQVKTAHRREHETW